MRTEPWASARGAHRAASFHIEPVDMNTLHRFSRLLLAALVTTGLLVVGCDSVGTDGTGNDTGDDAGGTTNEAGSFEVRLTDAPGDIVQAIVTIERVSVVSAEDSSEGDAREGGIELLSDSAFTVDLTKLQAGIDTALARTDSIPPGTYSQIRLVTADTADVLYETTNGDTARADLKQPSASETGIKINFEPVTIDEASDEAEVTLDFSLKDSFVKAGQSGMFIFKPVVQAEAVVANGDTTSAGS